MTDKTYIVAQNVLDLNTDQKLEPETFIYCDDSLESVIEAMQESYADAQKQPVKAYFVGEGETLRLICEIPMEEGETLKPAMVLSLVQMTHSEVLKYLLRELAIQKAREENAKRTMQNMMQTAKQVQIQTMPDNVQPFGKFTKKQ